MDDVIRLLPEGIANQIAAGEVVQRPASVVKELLENAVDAGAKSIELIVRESGKSLVQVVDDGVGMSTTDARMSFERHATSKITQSEDLFRIRTMGFRGEALASIAAVAQVEMRTRLHDQEVGTEIVVQGSEIKKHEPIATAPGTSIGVKNLFFNVPARRNFLKSNPVEYRHISDEFHRVALAYPDIAFTFFNNDAEAYRLERGKLSKRIVQLFNRNYQQQLIPVEETTPDVKVQGYIGKPEYAKKTRGEQFFFVNGRYIKNNYLNHAVSTAYDKLIPDDFHPFYVLFLEMDPARVDINVHPTKTEVKFQDERLLYGIILSSVRQALSKFNVSPSLDFDSDVNFEYFTSRRETMETPSDRNYERFRAIDQQEDRGALNWEKLYDIAKREDEDVRQQAQMEMGMEADAPTTMRVPSGMALDREANSATEASKSLQLHGRYVVRQVKSGMVIIDQSAAHERILFEKYLRTLDGARATSQSCLFPQQLSLSDGDFTLVQELRQEIRQLGFDFETFGSRSIVLTGVPADLSNHNEREIVEGLIEQFKDNRDKLRLEQRENLARALATRTSISRGKVLDNKEADELIDQLFACEQPNYTPNGHPTFVVLGLDQIASYFKK
ncbi:MAG: DNA mismatch repair endonuclease MutL [Bacteroidota bacterium]